MDKNIREKSPEIIYLDNFYDTIDVKYFTKLIIDNINVYLDKKLKLYWGINNSYNDITDICYNKLIKNGKIIIPKDETYKLFFFGDPAERLVKHIKVIDIIGNEKIFDENYYDIIIELNCIFKNN